MCEEPDSILSTSRLFERLCGNAESIALYLKHIGMETAYFWIVAALFATAFIAATLMPDTQREGRLGR